MEVALWGTRGSLASPGPETVQYGGNTACVEVRGRGSALVLDAGTGVRRLGDVLGTEAGRVDVLLTHLHMDHIQGLGFFAPLYQAGREVHIWGPSSTTMGIKERLARYLSPPLFPLRLRELPCDLHCHDVPFEAFEIGEFRITAKLVCHPGPTVGYRIEDGGASLAYLPDHEPALGWPSFPGPREWTSGFDVAEGADLMIHDTQYTAEEYGERIGWGHSSLEQTVAFANLAGVSRFVTFHHDPKHSDAQLDDALRLVKQRCDASMDVIAGTEGLRLSVP
jgi:phosphoribosyl 1,2-cyclic phosphodiesterase